MKWHLRFLKKSHFIRGKWRKSQSLGIKSKGIILHLVWPKTINSLPGSSKTLSKVDFLSPKSPVRPTSISLSRTVLMPKELHINAISVEKLFVSLSVSDFSGWPEKIFHCFCKTSSAISISFGRVGLPATNE